MKKPLIYTLAICAAVWSLNSCNTATEEPAVDMTALTAEIQAVEDAYATAATAKDAAAVVAYYADDAVSYPSNNEPMVGKEAIQARLAERMAKDTTNTTPVFKVLDIFAAGDYVTEVGSWTDTDASGTVTDKGTYISVFQKKDGKWLCIRDMSVSSMPKKEAMAEAVPAAE